MPHAYPPILARDLETIGMAQIAAIILAAGKSSRFSRDRVKLVADFKSRANPVIVVTGCARE
jgi:hypothetical protein